MQGKTSKWGHFNKKNSKLNESCIERRERIFFMIFSTAWVRWKSRQSQSVQNQSQKFFAQKIYFYDSFFKNMRHCIKTSYKAISLCIFAMPSRKRRVYNIPIHLFWIFQNPNFSFYSIYPFNFYSQFLPYSLLSSNFSLSYGI